MSTQLRTALCALALAVFAATALGQGVTDPRKSTPTPTPTPVKVHKVGTTTVRKAGGDGTVAPECNKPVGTNVHKACCGGESINPSVKTRKSGGELTPLCNKPVGTHTRKTTSFKQTRKTGGQGVVTPNCSKVRTTGGQGIVRPNCSKVKISGKTGGSTRAEYPNLRKAGGQGIVRPNCSKTNLPAIQNQNNPATTKPDAPPGTVPK